MGSSYVETQSGPSPVAVSGGLVGDHIRQAQPASNPGSLGGESDAWSNGHFHSGEARSVSSFRLQDLVFTSPASEPIDVTLHLVLEGTSSRAVSSSGELNQNQVAIGVDFVAAGVPVNTPVALRVELATSARADQWTCRAVPDLGNTFSCPATGDVFTVPAGVVVNSPDGGIVNNRWLPGGAVPVKSTTWSGIKRVSGQ